MDGFINQIGSLIEPFFSYILRSFNASAAVESQSRRLKIVSKIVSGY